MVHLLVVLVINLHFCAGFLQSEDPPDDLMMETQPPGANPDPGEPLFLTPYIENGDIEVAQQLAQVNLHNFDHIKSYSGFLTVDKTYNTNLFFWYFPANRTSPYHKPKSAEVVIYMESSITSMPNELRSLYGQFKENGPFFSIPDSLHIEEREWALNKHRHVIYIDHAPGMGFSFTDDWRGHPESSEEIGELLYTATLQIFKLFPVLQEKYLCIMGEMVAAKYAAALAYIIDQNKNTADINIKLQRLYLISPWIDPMTQVGYYHKHAYDIGYIDEHVADVALGLEQIIQNNLKYKQWNEALSSYSALLRELNIYSSYDYSAYGYWLIQNKARKALHVGNLTFKNYGIDGREALKKDYMQSAVVWLRELARKGYIIFLANGPLNLVAPFRSMYDSMKIIDDRTIVVNEAAVVDRKKKTYQAYLYMGALNNSRTIAVLQQKVDDCPWMNGESELTWNVVDFLQDFVPPGLDTEDGYDSHSERLVYKLKNDKKGNINHNFWGYTT